MISYRELEKLARKRMHSVKEVPKNQVGEGETGASVAPAAAVAATTADVSTAPAPTKPRFPLYVYKLAVLFATVLWGLSFFIMKSAVDQMPPAFLLGTRFVICGLLMVAVFWRRMRAGLSLDYLKHGLVIGTLLFVAYWFQTIGLMDTTPGKNAFLTATYCVIVPFAWWVIAKRRPTAFNVVAAVLCVTGIGFVSLTGSDTAGALIGRGDALTLVCALFFALHIVYVARVSPGRDIFVLTAYQFLVAGVLAMVVSLTTEPPVTSIVITGQLIIEVAYLTFFASFLALLIQNVALQHVPPAQVSLILCLESVFGVLFSVLFAGEQLTAMLVVGFVLIFCAIVLSESGADLLAKLTGREVGEAKAKEPEPGSTPTAPQTRRDER